MTLPAEIVERLTKSMLPEKVCLTCGKPSRRIVSNRTNFESQVDLATHIKERRLASGFSRPEVNAWFHVEAGIQHWEATDQANARVPRPDDYTKLKILLSLSDEFDDFVFGERRWTESEIEYRDVSDYPSGWTQDSNGKVYQRLESRKDRIAPDHFSDCGHDDWRPGSVLIFE